MKQRNISVIQIVYQDYIENTKLTSNCIFGGGLMRIKSLDIKNSRFAKYETRTGCNVTVDGGERGI